MQTPLHERMTRTVTRERYLVCHTPALCSASAAAASHSHMAIPASDGGGDGHRVSPPGREGNVAGSTAMQQGSPRALARSSRLRRIRRTRRPEVRSGAAGNTRRRTRTVLGSMPGGGSTPGGFVGPPPDMRSADLLPRTANEAGGARETPGRAHPHARRAAGAAPPRPNGDTNEREGASVDAVTMTASIRACRGRSIV